MKTICMPIYKMVYLDIKNKIEDGTYAIGVLLPSEPKLEKEYVVSRTTVRKAIDLLTKENLIAVKQGYGTEVINNKSSQSLNRITSVSQTLKSKGFNVGVSSQFIQVIQADANLASDLSVAVGDKIIEINRIQTADNIPVTISKNYIPLSLVSGLERLQTPIVSLYQYISDKYDIQFTEIKDKISACSATFEEANAMQINPNDALITIKRVCYCNKKPVEVDDVKIIASQYEYESYFSK